MFNISLPVISPREKAKRLLAKAEWAVHQLLNDPQADGAKVLADHVALWEREVLELMEELELTESDKSYFRVLRSYQPSGVGGVTPEYAKIREELNEKIRRLREIAGRIEGVQIEGVPPIALHAAGDESRPRLKFTHEPGVKPYFEESLDRDEQLGNPITRRWLRIALENTSGASIDQVRVVLESCQL